MKKWMPVLLLPLSLIPSAALSQAPLEKITFARQLAERHTQKVQFVTVDEVGNLYVITRDRNEILVLNPNGEVVRTIGSAGKNDGQFKLPRSLTVDRLGVIYVADTGNHRIQKFNAEGRFIEKFGESGSKAGKFSGPTHLALDRSGNIYVVDNGNGRIQVFSNDGIYLSSFGKSERAEERLSNPSGIALDKNNNIFVADTGNHRIQVFDPNGNFLRSFGKQGEGRGQFSRPVDIAIDDKDRIFVLEQDNHRIQILSLTGNYFMEIGSEGSGKGQFKSPQGLALDKVGGIYIADYGNNRIGQYTFGSVQAQALKDLPKFTGLKQKAAVLQFRSNNPEAAGFGDTISDMFTTALGGTGYFDLVERKELDKIIGEMALGQSGIIDDTQAIQKLQVAGVEMVISGSVSKFDNVLDFDVRSINTRTVRIELTRNSKAASEEIRGKVAEIAENFLLKAGPPKAPSGILAVGENRRIGLRWNQNPEPDLAGYRVERSESPQGEFKEIARVVQNSYTDTGLGAGATYYYKIAAYDATQLMGEPSSAAFATTQLPPDPPSGLGYDPDIRKVVLSWEPSAAVDRSGAALKGYRVWRAEKADGSYESRGEVQAGDKLHFSDTSVLEGREYFFRLTAVNVAGVESDPSAVLPAKSLGPPTGLQAMGAPRKVSLKWTPPASSNLKGYQVYRREGPSGEYVKVKILTDRNQTAFVDEGGWLKDATDYYYRVSALNKGNDETELSDEVRATTKPVPDSPSGLSAQSSLPRRVELSWTAHGDPDVTGYHVYRGGGPESMAKVARLAGRGKTFFKDESEDGSPLKDGAEYLYAVSAVNVAEVEGPPSEPVKATTKFAPQVPRGLAARSGEVKKVTLSWGRNPEPDIKRYLVFRKDEGRDFREIARVEGGRDTYEDEGLGDGASFTYRVRAEDADGLLSGFSEQAPATVKPLPSVPEGLTGEAAEGRIRLSWKPSPEPDIRHYRVYEKNFLDFGSQIGESREPAFTVDSGLKPDKEYRYYITALDETGLESPASGTVTVRTPK